MRLIHCKIRRKKSKQPFKLPADFCTYVSRSRNIADRYCRHCELFALSGERNPYEAKLGVLQRDAWANMLPVNGDPLQNSELLNDYERNVVVIAKNVQVWKNILSNSGLSVTFPLGSHSGNGTRRELPETNRKAPIPSRSNSLQLLRQSQCTSRRLYTRMIKTKAHHCLDGWISNLAKQVSC